MGKKSGFAGEKMKEKILKAIYKVLIENGYTIKTLDMRSGDTDELKEIAVSITIRAQK